MEFQDHDYTNNGSDRVNPMEFTYKSKYGRQETSGFNTAS